MFQNGIQVENHKPLLFFFSFFSFLAGGFFNGFFAGKNKNYTRKSTFFSKKISKIQ
jgi:hypothetical protein